MADVRMGDLLAPQKISPIAQASPDPDAHAPLPLAALDPKLSAPALDAVRQRQRAPARADNAPIAPWPAIDRYPTILGSHVSLAYISSVFRLCLTGYRREYVDMLSELLERDPHMYAVCAQRIHAVSGGQIEVVAADCEEGSADAAKAEEYRALVERRLNALPDLQQSLSRLQWGGLFFGVGASEISWAQDEDGWYPARLHWIHSRRIAYPDPVSWSPRIWDQGMVSSWDVLSEPTGQLFGVRCDDFPGKFLVHTPGVRGEYPTRDGLGRQCAYWSALKLMGARGASQYIERFGKPWVIGYYRTIDGEPEGTTRAADKDDIAALEAAGKALGVGGLAYGTLPDSTKVDVFGPAVNSPGRQMMHAQYIALCNAEISKAVLGQTDTTESSPNGSRSAVEVRKQGTQELYRYDAAALGDTLYELSVWIVRLNGKPGDEHLAPKIVIHAVQEPDPDAEVERALKLTTAGAPVDADDIAEKVGIKLLEPEDKADKRGRRLYPLIPAKAADKQAMLALERGEEVVDPEAAKLAQADADRQANAQRFDADRAQKGELEKGKLDLGKKGLDIKAKQPPPAPPGAPPGAPKAKPAATPKQPTKAPPKGG